MLDRLSLSLVTLPEATYEIVLILLDVDGSRAESQKLLSRDLLPRVVAALKPGGRLRSQDGNFASVEDSEERREVIFSGLVIEGNEVAKPNYEAVQSVPLRIGRNKENGGPVAVTSAIGTGAVSLNLNGKRKNGPPDVTQPAGVGFVDFSDDFDAPAEEEDDDDLIDEDTLLDEADLKRPAVQRKSKHPFPDESFLEARIDFAHLAPECRPKSGKRRRACKDCTCGLAQRLEAEDAAKRNNADQALAKLKVDELAEVDFTAQGKVGSCGNCALGDAFRCDGW